MKTPNISENVSWKDITPGGVTWNPGSAQDFITGDWRSERPIYLEDKCKQCRLCSPVCPDSAIKLDETGDKMIGFDYDYCKGCGVCAAVCPFKAITMEGEGK